MGKVTGFLELDRQVESYREVEIRIKDFGEIFADTHNLDQLKEQGARCMDCGVPFCQSSSGCPIDNLIPEWNDLVYNNEWKEALERLEKTNNFPEFTGRVCPAPCEGPLLLEFPLSDRLPDRLPDRWLEFRDEEFPDDCPVGWDFGFFARFGFESLIGRELGRS